MTYLYPEVIVNHHFHLQLLLHSQSARSAKAEEYLSYWTLIEVDWAEAE